MWAIYGNARPTMKSTFIILVSCTLSVSQNHLDVQLDFWQPPKRVGGIVDVMVPPQAMETTVSYLARKNLTFEVTISDVKR